MLDFARYCIACLLDQRKGRDCGQGIEDHPATPATKASPLANTPKIKYDKEALDAACEQIERELEAMPKYPRTPIDKRPKFFPFRKAADILQEYLDNRVPAEWYSDTEDPEPWYTFAQGVAAQGILQSGGDDVFVLDLTASNMEAEVGPNAGGYVIIGDVEMLVTLLLYAAPHTTDSRALAVYQVEVL